MAGPAGPAGLDSLGASGDSGDLGSLGGSDDLGGSDGTGALLSGAEVSGSGLFWSGVSVIICIIYLVVGGCQEVRFSWAYSYE